MPPTNQGGGALSAPGVNSTTVRHLRKLKEAILLRKKEVLGRALARLGDGGEVIEGALEALLDSLFWGEFDEGHLRAIMIRSAELVREGCDPEQVALCFGALVQELVDLLIKEDRIEDVRHLLEAACWSLHAFTAGCLRVMYMSFEEATGVRPGLVNRFIRAKAGEVISKLSQGESRGRGERDA